MHYCGKFHEGVCNAPKKDAGNSSSSSSTSSSSISSGDNKANTNKFDKWKKPKKGQSFHETIDLDNEIQLNNLSETNHSCVFPFKIHTKLDQGIDIMALIDTGANSANYISQHLFDRLKDAGHLPQPVQGTVRGGLNTGGQQVACSYSMSFPISCMSEICTYTESKCNKHKCHFERITNEATAKLLPIDYDLIIGLPSIRK